MGPFFSYIFLGLSLAAPIGPINAAQLDKGIKNGFWHAWLLGIGATVADALYMILVYFGSLHFLGSDFMKTFLWSFGAFVLIYTGIESLMSAGKIVQSKKTKNEPVLKCFFSGFILSLTNPLTILFWLGIYGSVLAKTADAYATEQLVMYSCAIFIGVLSWDITMAALASTFRKYLSAHFLTVVSILSGVSLIGFGFYFGWQAFQLLFS
ncbi:amino acid transporter [Priestia megaterium]|nr:amino acid transporter [Priestia megaterium]